MAFFEPEFKGVARIIQMAVLIADIYHCRYRFDFESGNVVFSGDKLRVRKACIMMERLLKEKS